MNNRQTNTIIEQNGKNFLIDAGGDIRFSLAACGLSYKDIDSAYFTHLHADHVGGVEYLAFCSYFDPTMDEKISFIGNSELVREGWNNSLKGGLKSIQGKKLFISWMSILSFPRLV
jgi:ribonuclease BN (tRNA processing enzyme)